MARYWARLNSANVIEQVAKIEGFDGKSDAQCIAYLKSIYKNENWKEGFKTDPNPRGNYPSVGLEYLPEFDVFVTPKPFASWTLSEDKRNWQAPVPYPVTYNWTNDAEHKTAQDIALSQQMYKWDEDSGNWVSI